ncbi:MAG TPA: hypothetical protein VGQ21_20225 [Thermoanaerobaculia bacterium]|jgi:hypothetical protein|nr:hypothetical protein [Thermoanaerobaculia bacterium]
MNNDDDAKQEERSCRKRGAGHYLLLVMAIVFFAEEFVFLVWAIHNAGRQQGTAARFLALTIGVFLTAVAALYGFVHRIDFAVGLFFGLLLIQPAVSAFANAVGRAPQHDLLVALGAGVAGAALLSVAVTRNRAQ